MGRFTLSAAGLAAVLSFGFGINQAGATPFAPAQGLGSAAGELGIVETVHCRPGWAHHFPNRWRRANGCGRFYRHGVIVVPGRRFIYRDGVRVRVGVGSRFRGGTRTTIRSGGSTTIRSGGGATVGGSGGATVRSGSGATVGGSGGANVRGGATVGGSGGANVRGGGGSNPPAGGSGQQAPAGQTR